MGGNFKINEFTLASYKKIEKGHDETDNNNSNNNNSPREVESEHTENQEDISPLNSAALGNL